MDGERRWKMGGGKGERTSVLFLFFLTRTRRLRERRFKLLFEKGHLEPPNIPRNVPLVREPLTLSAVTFITIMDVNFIVIHYSLEKRSVKRTGWRNYTSIFVMWNLTFYFKPDRSGKFFLVFSLSRPLVPRHRRSCISPSFEIILRASKCSLPRVAVTANCSFKSSVNREIINYSNRNMNDKDLGFKYSD